MRTVRRDGREFRVWQGSAGAKLWACAELDANGFMLQMAHSLATEGEADAIVTRWAEQPKESDAGA